MKFFCAAARPSRSRSRYVALTLVARRRAMSRTRGGEMSRCTAATSVEVTSTQGVSMSSSLPELSRTRARMRSRSSTRWLLGSSDVHDCLK
jgi:hypothetical protein